MSYSFRGFAEPESTSFSIVCTMCPQTSGSRPPVAHLKSRSKIEAADVLGLALAKPKHPSHVWSRKQSQGRRALGETVWQQNPNSRRYFWESSHRVKAADSALGESQIKVADVVLGLRDISVREVATVTPFAVDGAHSLGFAWRGPF